MPRSKRAAIVQQQIEDTEHQLHSPDIKAEEAVENLVIPTNLELPVLPVRNTVLMPNIVAPLFIGREASLKAVEEAMSKDRLILVVAQKNTPQDDPAPQDLYSVGTEGVIGRVLKMPDGTISILIQGQRRLKWSKITQTEPYLKVQAEPVSEVFTNTPSLQALMRAVLSLFEKCVKLSRNLPDEAYVTALNIDEPGWLADFIASTIELSVAKRQSILEAFDPVDRLTCISEILSNELNILEIETKIHSQVQQEVDKNQREYFLREQLKAIQHELSETDPFMQDTQELAERIEDCGMPEEVAQRAHKELERLSAMPSMAPDVAVIRTYLDWLVSLPWKNKTEDQLNLEAVSKALNANHYGLDNVKERILEYIAVRKLASEPRTPIICFVGPPGVGKTSLGKSIAQAVGRKFARISLGGVRDEAEIRGHRRTYVGALPGRLIQAMRTAGTINPVFMLDEIDKLGADYRGDPSAALLEVLDPEQNKGFSDHYLEVPYDLSEVLFITTANVLDTVPPALRDRLEIIELPGYTETEKIHIAQNFLIPRQMHENGLSRGKIDIEDSALHKIINEYTYEAGVRNLEREIGSVMRKVARKVADGRKSKTIVTSKNIEQLIGHPKHFQNKGEKDDEIGIATGVAWTAGGGDLITIEALLMEGKGNLILTGHLGDVMRESAQAALSYARSRSQDLSIRKNFWEKLDIHIHVPAGATPKDGPSAGVTMATALISAASKRASYRHVAMTGEITLRGHVLPVGGIKEKVLAAHRAGIKIFLLPKLNASDLDEVPLEIRSSITFIPVEHMDEVINIALHPETKRIISQTKLAAGA